MTDKYKINQFNERGFAVLKNEKVNEELLNFTKSWINSLLGEFAAKEPTEIHKIIIDNSFYSQRLIQKKRHLDKTSIIHKILDEYNISSFIREYWSNKWNIWDEGFGSLGIRIVRPNSNDGYSWSCKSWGPAKNVLSFSLVQFIDCPDSATSVIPNSHKLLDLPHKKENSIHCKDELRLDIDKFDISKSLKPAYNPGDLLITHPNLIHTEKNYSRTHTRVSLEFRLSK